MRIIDGSHGEGGGQILRSALTLAAVTGDAIQVTNIRANRRKPGLRPQHLTAVRAVAAICDARLEGDALDSQTLTFEPQTAPQAGNYTFDVTREAGRGSAGSMSLVLQAMLLPLALADGPSRVFLRGGTTVPMSPPALFIERIYLPTLFEMGVRAKLTHRVWGFYPKGGGELDIEIKGGAKLRPLNLTERGDLERVEGIAYVAQLPSHIPQRMSDRVRSLLRDEDVHVQVTPQHVTSPGVGAGLFLIAHYEHTVAGFHVLGRRGLPSERVAEMAVRKLQEHHWTGAAADPHLGDQLVLPFALCVEPSWAAVSEVTSHLLTNVWVASHFDVSPAHVEGEVGKPGLLAVGE